MEMVVAMTGNNVITIGSQNDLGLIRPGKLADVIILRGDPLSDIRVLRGGTYLSTIIKDGRVVMNDGKSTLIDNGETQKDRVALRGLGL